ncbi:hypothetical protein BHU72_14090 [Desulfuribacillus stibiiarsenatis]|uniref:KOW domain-containing protein n=1 Tax=Desulfuribacillus stibiiarsenatis TaxID=1390249 RepID=A0A1E5L8N4_9FIRM|nr:KOW domain-containing RNA-binding protein [Desulfuribacillus stibiiarsenatis]OEH86349.1 hypothetical protein BHU72_14090 [Desulfuribacillus stibiiarsenatis]
MKEEEGTIPQIGHIVKVTHGREAGKCAVVIDVSGHNLVKLADGDKRKFDCPKTKNVRHITIVDDQVCKEVVESLQETGRVSNSKLRFVINRYIESTATESDSEAPKKGV